MKNFSTSAIYGLGERPEGVGLCYEAQDAYERLQKQAMLVGIQLTIASAYRSFERQLLLWNRKAVGDLPVLDDQGRRLDMGKLSDLDKVFSILRWSALPGASRHHWGTDCDVYDRAVMSPVDQLLLTTQEAYGKFAVLHQWLDERIATGQAEGFFRPYDQDRGGIAPEPWHLSYRPLAEYCQQAFHLEQLREILTATDILLKETILANLVEIHQRFIQPPQSC